MVDCFDRIAVQMTELALEPVRELAARPLLAAVSLRTPSGGRRYTITVHKRFPAGPGATPAYTWSLEETTPGGDTLPGNGQVNAPTGQTWPVPEDAYWAAVGGLCALQRSDG